MIINVADDIRRIIEAEKIPHWDVYTQRTLQGDLHLIGYNIETIRDAESFGYAIRSFGKKEGKIGIGMSSGSLLGEKQIMDRVLVAKRNSEVPNAPAYDIPQQDTFSEVKITDPKIIQSSEEVIKDKAEELASLLKDQKGVVPTFTRLDAYVVETGILNSSGLSAEKNETFLYLELALKSEEGGKLAEYWIPLYFRGADELNLKERIPYWSKLAVDNLHAKPPKTEKTTVVMPPHVIHELLKSGLAIGTVGYHASGRAKFENKSKFSVDKKVAGENITIEDDGLLDFGIATSPFDDEGVPQRTKTIIENGIFKEVLYDTVYAAATGQKSTGNGIKVPRPPSIDMKFAGNVVNQGTNIVVKGGNFQSFDELIEDIKHGIYVVGFAWLYPDDLTSSFGTKITNGYLIENGELTTPLKGGQVSGFAFDHMGETLELGLMNKVSGMTKTPILAGKVAAPYMRFEDVQVSGPSTS
jgi:predicted Zn-dependent protease